MYLASVCGVGCASLDEVEHGHLCLSRGPTVREIAVQGGDAHWNAHIGYRYSLKTRVVPGHRQEHSVSGISKTPLYATPLTGGFG